MVQRSEHVALTPLEILSHLLTRHMQVDYKVISNAHKTFVAIIKYSTAASVSKRPPGVGLGLGLGLGLG